MFTLQFTFTLQNRLTIGQGDGLRYGTRISKVYFYVIGVATGYLILHQLTQPEWPSPFSCLLLFFLQVLPINSLQGWVELIATAKKCDPLSLHTFNAHIECYEYCSITPSHLFEIKEIAPLFDGKKISELWVFFTWLLLHEGGSCKGCITKQYLYNTRKLCPVMLFSRQLSDKRWKY